MTTAVVPDETLYSIYINHISQIPPALSPELWDHTVVISEFSMQTIRLMTQPPWVSDPGNFGEILTGLPIDFL